MCTMVSCFSKRKIATVNTQEGLKIKLGLTYLVMCILVLNENENCKYTFTDVSNIKCMHC